MGNLAGEIRLAFRAIRKSPAFTLMAVCLLALGIGANTAIFSLVNAVLLRPLPYRSPDELVLLWESMPLSSLDAVPAWEANYLEWRDRQRVFSAMSGFRLRSRALTGIGEPQPVNVVTASANLFDTLGVAPRLGKGFSPGDDHPGAPPVAVISDSLWRSRLGADPAAVGRTIRLDGVSHTVVGVLPAGFLFPPPLSIMGNLYEFPAQVFVPVPFVFPGRPERDVVIVGRLKPGLSIAQAESDLQEAASQIAAAMPAANPDQMGALLMPLHGQAVGTVRTGLAMLLGAVALVLLIACVNVANLLLVRASSRRREVAIRLALGAGRVRVVRLLLAESLLLALLGGAAGILAARWSLDSLTAVSAGHIPQLGPVALDGTVLAFTLALTLLTGILFGLAPALQASRPDLSQSLKDSARGGSASRGGPVFRAFLVVAETALAVLLLAGAGLLLKSFLRVQQVEVGFEAAQARIFDIRLPESRYAQDFEVQGFFRRLLSEIGAQAGVRGAGAVSGLPLSGDRNGVFLEIEGRPTATTDERTEQLIGFRVATPGYFEAMGIPVLQGRPFQDSDLPDSLPVALIDQAAAQRFWPDGDALNARVTHQDDADPDIVWRQLAGVVGNVRQESLDKRTQFEGTVYFPLSQLAFRTMSVVVRTDLGPEAVHELIRRQVAELDPELPVRTRRLESLVQGAESERRSLALLSGSFAALAVLLSLIGLYGVMSSLVEQRAREIGLRMALGARRGDILRLVARQTTVWVLAGIAIGLAGALGLSKALSALLFEVSPIDPSTYLGVSALFAAVALLAGALPARRASRVDPAEVLRWG